MAIAILGGGDVHVCLAGPTGSVETTVQNHDMRTRSSFLFGRGLQLFLNLRPIPHQGHLVGRRGLNRLHPHA
eukprot:10123158-Alexandrium_andersonii.AAC.1